MLQGMAEAGYTVTITGHSLGAGAAAMIGLLLRRRGVKVSRLAVHTVMVLKKRDLCCRKGKPHICVDMC